MSHDARSRYFIANHCLVISAHEGEQPEDRSSRT